MQGVFASKNIDNACGTCNINMLESDSKRALSLDAFLDKCGSRL